MKCKLIPQLIFISRHTLLSVLMQCWFCSMLLASDSVAERKSIEEIFVEIKLENASLQQVLAAIEEKTQFHFVYNEKTLKKHFNIDIEGNSQSLGDVLRKISRQTQLAFKRIGDNIHISERTDRKEAVEEVLGSSAPPITVTGTVTSQSEGEGIPGVNVILKGTTTGTVTDVDGKYYLNVPNEDDILVFSSIGYTSQEVAVNGRSVIDVALAEDVRNLDEVVVVGYGTVQKKDLTGSVAHIDAEKLENGVTSNMTDLLRTNVPGLNLNFNTSAKGLSSASEMLIRGNTSLRANDNEQQNANAPLIVVDGMIYYGDLADINPMDIGSIDVLKDASSAAIFGSRASNGVIIITTKKGKTDKPTINVTTSIGLSDVSHAHIDPMTAEEFINFRIAGYEGNQRKQINNPGYYDNPDNLPAGVSLEQWKAYDGSAGASDLEAVWLSRLGFRSLHIENYKAGKITNWKDHIYQTGITQNYNLSVSGKSSAVSYYWSLGYTNNEGIQYNDSFKNIRSRLNLEAKVTDWLKVGTNTQFAARDESPITPRLNGRLDLYPPYAPFYESDGETLYFEPSDGLARHPMGDIGYEDRFLKYETLISKLYGSITLPHGFSFTTEFIPRFNKIRNYHSYSSASPAWKAVGGRASRSNTTIFDWQFNNILKWNKSFGIHSFDFTFLQNAEMNQSWMDIIDRQGFAPNDYLGYHRMQSATENVKISSNDEVSTADALMARMNYTLMSKYNLSASFRRDGYSAFGQSNPRSNFGSFAVGWIMSEENFYNIQWMDIFKLRLSYGTNGNRGIGVYDALANLTTGKLVLIKNGTPQYVSLLYTSRMANPELKWERTAAYNIGVDFSMFKGKLSGNVEAYYMRTTDLLIPRLLPDITGFNSVFSNLGQVDNKGLEISLTSINIDKNSFRWNTDFSISHNKNEIVHLYGDTTTDKDGTVKEVDDIGNGWFIGHAVDEIWDYQILGIWQASEKDEAERYSRSPGDFKLWDYDGDGYYTNADKQFQGNQIPKFQLTLRNNVQYKNWEFSVSMYSFLGYFSSNNHKKNNDEFYTNGSSYRVPYWTPENPGNEWARVGSYSSGFTVWENNSFVRLNNLTLTYNFPQSLLDKVNVASCKMSIIATNPLVWSPDWTWMDPESNKHNPSYGSQEYAPSYYSLKLNLTL